MIVSWPAGVTAGVSDAPVSQIDLYASFARLVEQEIPGGAAPDSEDALDVLLGRSGSGRSVIMQQGYQGLAMRSGDWKYIPPHQGREFFKEMRSGNSDEPQLYHLEKDPGETTNLITKHPGKLRELADIFNSIRR